MTAWTNIPNSSLESGAPIRAVDGVAFRDNPIAIAEGALGAPRVDPILAMEHQGAVGAVGTYAFCKFHTPLNDTDYAPGATVAGSSLRYAGIKQFNTPSISDGATLISTVVPTGTWRCMGYSENEYTDSTIYYNTTTLWLRIA